MTIVHEDTYMGGRIRPLGRVTFGLTLIPYRNFGIQLMGSADFYVECGSRPRGESVRSYLICSNLQDQLAEVFAVE